MMVKVKPVGIGKLGRGSGGLGKKRTSGAHPNDSIIKMIILRRVLVT